MNKRLLTAGLMDIRIIILVVSLLDQSLCSCPEGFYQIPFVNICPQTRCFQLNDNDTVVRHQQSRQDVQSLCTDRVTNNAEGEGGLLEFQRIEEFNRVRLILQTRWPSSPYLTALMYNSEGTLVYVNGARTRPAAGTVNTSLPLTGPPNKCVGIGVVGNSIDLVVMECNTSQAYICDLTLNTVPAPVLRGDHIRYVGPDRQLTLRCDFSDSSVVQLVVWLRNGVDIKTQFSLGYTITPSPVKYSELVFTSFDRTNHLGNYQCMLIGQLGNSVSKSVSVVTAVAPQIQNGPLNLSVPMGSIGFFSCFPHPDTFPSPTVTWFKDSAVLNTLDRTKYLVNTRSGRLFISNVNTADQGVYSCELQNVEGLVRSIPGGRLTVNNTQDLQPGYLLLPDFDTQTITVQQGDNLTVDCAAKTSHPRVNYVWEYPSSQQSVMSTTYGYRNRGNNAVLPAYFGNLILTNIQTAQSGMFSVQVQLVGVDPEDPGGSINAEYNGQVMVDVQSAPTISSLTISHFPRLGESCTLQCVHGGSPSPGVQWFRNGTLLLPNSTGHDLSGNELRITNVQPEHLTSYQCFVSNAVDTAMKRGFLCRQNGVPGPVTVVVEPFTTTSVRIKWDPPPQPNDDIELLTYHLYYDRRNIKFSSTQSFDITSLSPQAITTWQNRSVILKGVMWEEAVVAAVVAVSPQGKGAKPDPNQISVGYTYGNAPTQAPMNLAITRLNSSSVLMTWDPLVSSRNVTHDITYYTIEYRLIRTDTPNPKSIAVNTTSNSPSLVLSIPQDEAAHQVMEARVKGVTQVSKEPVDFLSGPFSAYQSEDNKPVMPSDTKGVIIAVVSAVLALIVIGIMATTCFVCFCILRCKCRQTGTYPVTYIKGNGFALDPGGATIDDREVHLEGGVSEGEEPPYCPVEVFVTAVNPMVMEENLSNFPVEKPIGLGKNPSNFLISRTATQSVEYINKTALVPGDDDEEVHLERGVSEIEEPPYCPVEVFVTADSNIVMERKLSNFLVENHAMMDNNPSHPAVENTMVERNLTYFVVNDPVVMEKNPSYSALDNSSTVKMERNPSYSALDNSSTVKMERNPSYSALDNTNTLVMGRNWIYSDPQDTDAQETTSPLNAAPSTTDHDDGSDSDHDYV